jgi:hypothetical protein
MAGFERLHVLYSRPHHHFCKAATHISQRSESELNLETVRKQCRRVDLGTDVRHGSLVPQDISLDATRWSSKHASLSVNGVLIPSCMDTEKTALPMEEMHTTS